ncbi:MAG TPA: bifunctional folylpolyglutamate synthase/dihydrofolate synthase [Candidatus Anaerobutyricum stercoris]|uniref:tetrahydrofolate synthase n=1 Tax=Candidatus Anaerobutyricum stercoris TaxID=2838457 RepID=A0A9D2EKQ1_9FIRM|nr:bifunctional folylpolyglutamate synthase/dihydrofolate synthase [Candidatus Anaerobutyricum stercoris]
MEYQYHKIIEKLKKRGSTPGLEPVRALLAALKHPEEKIAVVHIAGTNGKGSVFAFLSAILQEGGYRVGRYISPTIHSYEERFQINGQEISPEKLEKYYVRMERAMEQMERTQQPPLRQPTLFEVETALAFLYFAEEQVDVALIETGMGGTHDATNVVEHPLLTVISSVSYDHKAFLGDTLEEIAGEKAGIIKENVPVVVEENVPEVCRIMQETAARKHAPCTLIRAADYQVETESVTGSTFIWKKHRFSIFLPGQHQISNAVTALAAAEELMERLPSEGRRKLEPGENARFIPAADKRLGWPEMERGLVNARWPGRLELLGERPYIFRDGAHNPDGARKLAQFLEKHFTNRRIIYIMGVLKDKEYEKMLAELMPLASEIYTFRPHNERGLSGEVLAACAQRFGVPSHCCQDVNEAIRRGREKAEQEDVIVICGSLSFMEEMEDTSWK